MREVHLNIYGADVSVFDDGSVWVHRGSRGKRRFGDITPKGYRKILLRDNGKERTVYVHRLVAKAYLPNPQNLPQVNHKDGNKLNNKPENLEWCTNEDNLAHRFQVLKHFNRKPVQCEETKETYESVSAAAQSTGIHRANIGMVCAGQRFTAGGYHWSFIGGDYN